jgi:hypothetical protein
VLEMGICEPELGRWTRNPVLMDVAGAHVLHYCISRCMMAAMKCTHDYDMMQYKARTTGTSSH